MVENTNEIVRLLKGTELLTDTNNRIHAFSLYSQHHMAGQFDIIVKSPRQIALKLFWINHGGYNYKIFANYIAKSWYASAQIFEGSDYIETVETISGNPTVLVEMLVNILRFKYPYNQDEFNEYIIQQGW